MRFVHRLGQVRSVRGLVVLVFGLWLMLRQVDGVLVRLQSDVAGSYGANDFWRPSPGGLVVHVRTLVEVWRANGGVAKAAFFTYTALDLVFIAAYSVLFLLLFARLSPPPAWRERPTVLGRLAARRGRLIAGLAFTDIVEDVLRAVLVSQDHPSAVLIYLAWAATWVKWVLLGCVVMLIVHAWAAHVASQPPAHLWSAVGRLRIPVVLIVSWGAFVLFDPTGQTADIFRRWLDDLGRLAASSLCSVAAAAVLGFAGWTTVRRAVLAEYKPKAEPRWWLWLLIAASLAALGFAAGWKNLWGPAGVIIGVLGLTVLAAGVRLFESDERKAEREQDDKLAHKLLEHRAQAPRVCERDEILRITRGLSTWPLVALFLGAATAWTAPPVVLFSMGEDRGSAWALTVAAAVALALAVGTAYLVPLLLRLAEGRGSAPNRRCQRRWPDQLEGRHVAVASVCLAVAGASILDPFGFPPTIGALATTAIAAATLLIALGEGQRYGDTHKPPLGLRALGFASIPVSLLVLVAYGAASIPNNGGYHAVARVASTKGPAAGGVRLNNAFENWLKRSCADASDAGATVPMVFVASHGGGIRAAYWTAGVLTDVLGGTETSATDNCRAKPIDRIFAMGGASGGSLGVTAFLGHASQQDAWYRKTLGDVDYAAIPLSWGLFVDAPRNFVGFRGPDRARRFEESWERSDGALKNDFFEGQGTTGPLLLLASTQVETGCRFNVSAIRLTSPDEKGRCATLLHRPAVTRLRAGQVVPDAPLTAEVLDYICNKGSLRRSTAALASARFPYVSPSGQFRCGEGSSTSVVDGGYAENTGAQAILNLWYRVRPLIAAYNRKKKSPRIVPIFINVDNHYSHATKAGPPPRKPELLVPPATRALPDKLDDVGVEQLVEAEFSGPLPGLPASTCSIGGSSSGDDAGTKRYVRIAPPKTPGIQAPLAWTLSKIAQRELDRQRRKALNTPLARGLKAVAQTGQITCT